MQPAVRVQHVTKRYGNLEVLKQVSCEVDKGQVAAIIGPSGAGKTTLLRCLNMLTRIDEGMIEVGGFAITSDPQAAPEALRAKVGIVFQQFNLWPHKTVFENLIEAPLLVRGLAREEAEGHARKWLKRIGLENKENVYPSTLSSGEQQRVALARALAMEPQVLLLDEITAALDPELVGEVLDTVKEIVHEHTRTVIVVTHEMAFARVVADQVIFLDRGKIVEQGSPQQIFDTPSQERTQQFLKRFRMRSYPHQ